MKHILIGFLICIFSVASLVGCEKVQQAADAIDKAKTFSDDIQKKAKEFIPGSGQKEGGGKQGETSDKHRQDKEEKDD